MLPVGTGPKVHSPGVSGFPGERAGFFRCAGKRNFERKCSSCETRETVHFPAGNDFGSCRTSETAGLRAVEPFVTVDRDRGGSEEHSHGWPNRRRNAGMRVHRDVSLPRPSQPCPFTDQTGRRTRPDRGCRHLRVGPGSVQLAVRMGRERIGLAPDRRRPADRVLHQLRAQRPACRAVNRSGSQRQACLLRKTPRSHRRRSVRNVEGGCRDRSRSSVRLHLPIRTRHPARARNGPVRRAR